MAVYSRETIVGFLLVLAAFVGGCQPVQPMPASAVAASEVLVESETVTDRAVISDSVTVVEQSAETPTATVVVSATVDVATAVAVDATETTMPDKATDEVDPALLEAGMAAYRAQYCGVCHTLSAAETRGTFGPEHDGMGATAAARIADGSYSGAATTPAEYIRESIVEPQAYTVPGYATTSHRMPSYAHLDEATLDGLVAFLLSQ